MKSYWVTQERLSSALYVQFHSMNRAKAYARKIYFLDKYPTTISKFNELGEEVVVMVFK